jgi:protein PsiE
MTKQNSLHPKFQEQVVVFLHYIEWVGLAIILLATIIAIGQEVYIMMVQREVLLKDILQLFIFLEIITMIGLYFSSGKLPIRYPIYIAMVAIARYISIGMKEMDGWMIVALSCSILILALAVLVIRYGHVNMPYSE